MRPYLNASLILRARQDSGKQGAGMTAMYLQNSSCFRRSRTSIKIRCAAGLLNGRVIGSGRRWVTTNKRAVMRGRRSMGWFESFCGSHIAAYGSYVAPEPRRRCGLHLCLSVAKTEPQKTRYSSNFPTNSTCTSSTVKPVRRRMVSNTSGGRWSRIIWEMSSGASATLPVQRSRRWVCGSRCAS